MGFLRRFRFFLHQFLKSSFSLKGTPVDDEAADSDVELSFTTQVNDESGGLHRVN